MKLVGALGILLGGAMIIGCSGAPQAKAPAAAAGNVGTATLTNATVVKRLFEVDPNPRYLSIDAETPDAPCTWGATPSEQQSTDADLARNPYTEQDIYDPR
jgi:hypothetical protein